MSMMFKLSPSWPLGGGNICYFAFNGQLLSLWNVASYWHSYHSMLNNQFRSQIWISNDFYLGRFWKFYSFITISLIKPLFLPVMIMLMAIVLGYDKAATATICSPLHIRVRRSWSSLHLYWSDRISRKIKS